MAADKIGIAWTVDPKSGWGIYGYNIIRHLCLHTPYTPVALEVSDLGFADPLEAELIKDRTSTPLNENPECLAPYAGTGRRLPFPVLHARGGNVAPQFSKLSNGVIGRRNHALTFFENARITARDVEIYNRFASVGAGSTWNANLLTVAGVKNVAAILQGIDPSLFHPAPKRGIFEGRFVIFAGGKMEYRKGQDIALKAVKIFVDRHPDALLLCVWGNHWPEAWSYKQFISSPYIDFVPPPDAEGRLQLPKWFEAFGLNRQNLYAFSSFPHIHTAALMREADVGLFPNRCEGGTNLVAMEAMACGLPTIISRNTGHLDIIHDGACLPLKSQDAVPAFHRSIDTAGWGESSIDEIVEALEFAYQNRDEAAEIGRKGAKRMHELSWDRQIAKLLAFIEAHGLD
jgi:glycosyltransferase involved in cell wall biosynthesis